jgi:fatty-acyl-CoA synthase
MDIIRKTIGQIIDTIAQEHSDDDAIIHTEMGVRYDYGFLLREVDQVAMGFVKAGIHRGDKVALWAPNIPEWIISMLAITKMGAITVPIDPGAGRDDLHFILEQSESRGIIMSKGLEDEEYVDMVSDLKAEITNLEHVFVIADKSYPGMTPWTALRAMGKEVDPEVLITTEDAVNPEDPVAIMYTSGTTGKPKGVVLDHLGLINKSMFSTERQGLNHTDRLCLFFPLFHMFGNTCIALAGLLRGAALIMPCQTFDPAKILSAIYDEKCTAIYASPSMIISLLEHPDFQKSRWASVCKGTIGGAPCPVELMKRLVEDIGVSHITVSYGITETSSWITMTKPNDPIELRVSTIGIPLTCNEVKIVDPATGEDLPPKTQGELCTRGFLMKEYYKMPGATTAAIDRDGWFHTGDLGEMDENRYVKVTGRLKDVIVRDGIEIYPVELEEIIYKLPEVSEVQVFGFPHPEKGHEVAAWIRVKEGSQLSLDDLAAHVRDNTDIEVAPQHFKFVSDFPMTRSGKVQKFKLAEQARKEYLDG